jgi:hypothetical protein
MPYGGLKGSGIGKEGPRYAVEEMTELKTVVFHERRPHLATGAPGRARPSPAAAGADLPGGGR